MKAARGNAVDRIPGLGPADEIGTFLSQSDENHLRRLVAWVRCEVGQSPEELVETTRRILDKIGDPSDYGKAALVEDYHKAKAVPQYVRAAIKALEKTLNRSKR